MKQVLLSENDFFCADVMDWKGRHVDSGAFFPNELGSNCMGADMKSRKVCSFQEKP